MMNIAIPDQKCFASKMISIIEGETHIGVTGPVGIANGLG